MAKVIAPAPILMRQVNFAFKEETDTGVFEPLTAADALTPVFNAAITYDIANLETPQDGSGAQRAKRRGTRAANISFETELYGVGGDVPGLPAWFQLLKGVGFGITGQVAAPIYNCRSTWSFGRYMPGECLMAAGAMGGFVLTGKAGETGRVRWNFKGLHVSPDASDIDAPIYDPQRAPVCSACVLTIGGQKYLIPQVEVEAQNELYLAPAVNALECGYSQCNIVNQVYHVRISPRAVPLTDRDWYDVHKSGTTVALSWQIGTAAQNKFTIAAPKLQLDTSPAEEDQNKIKAHRLDFICTTDTLAGGDELTITAG